MVMRPLSVLAQGEPNMPAPTLPRIDPARCTGCGRCVAVCAPHVLSLEPRGWVKVAVLDDAPGCTGCARCQGVCPFGAARMQRPPPDTATPPAPPRQDGK